MARVLRVFVIIALGLASEGCSFLFADGPPDRHQTMLYFDCTSTAGLEVADGMFALGTTLAGVGTLGMSEKEFEDQNNGGNRNTTAAVDFVVAGVFAGSAIYGIIVTESCSDAKDGLRQRIIERERRLAPPPAPPPAAPPPAALPPPAPTPAPPSTGGDAPPPDLPPPPPPATPAPPPASPVPAPKSGAPTF
jgi:hypothetical protein